MNFIEAIIIFFVTLQLYSQKIYSDKKLQSAKQSL
jgi:hypothetical protein